MRGCTFPTHLRTYDPAHLFQAGASAGSRKWEVFSTDAEKSVLDLAAFAESCENRLVQTMRMIVHGKPGMSRQGFATVVLLVLIGALSAPSWAACLKEAASSSMACCAEVARECPEMDQSMMCCSTGPQTNRESNAARLESVAASVMVQHDADLAVWMPLAVLVPSAAAVGVAPLVPDPPHLINSVLLI